MNKKGIDWQSPETLIVIILIVLFGILMVTILYTKIKGGILGLA